MVYWTLTQKKVYQEIESSYWALSSAEIGKKLGITSQTLSCLRGRVGGPNLLSTDISQSAIDNLLITCFGRTTKFKSTGKQYLFTIRADELKFDVRAYLEYPGYLEQNKKETLKNFPWNLPGKLLVLAYLYKAKSPKLDKISKKTRVSREFVTTILRELKDKKKITSVMARWKLSKNETEIWELLEKSLDSWIEFKQKHRSSIRGIPWKYSKSEKEFYEELFKALS